MEFAIIFTIVIWAAVFTLSYHVKDAYFFVSAVLAGISWTLFTWFCYAVIHFATKWW